MGVKKTRATKKNATGRKGSRTAKKTTAAALRRQQQIQEFLDEAQRLTSEALAKVGHVPPIRILPTETRNFRNLRSVIKHQSKLLPGALVKAVNGNLQFAAKKKTPVNHGNLKGSFYFSFAGGDITDDAVKISVGYTADYAYDVHEDLTAKHATGEAKFLEKAIKETKPMVQRILERELKL